MGSTPSRRTELYDPNGNHIGYKVTRVGHPSGVMETNIVMFDQLQQQDLPSLSSTTTSSSPTSHFAFCGPKPGGGKTGYLNKYS